MAWTRTRLEVRAITGDPSVLLAVPPPDGGWTPRPDRTVTVHVTVRSSCGLDLLRVCPLCQPSDRRSVPLPPPSDWGQRAEMKPVESVRYGRFASRVEGFRGWRALSAGLSWGGQPLRWRLSGDTDAMWLDRYGEDAGPTGLPHLDRTGTRPPTSRRVQWIPFPKEGHNEGTVICVSLVTSV